MRPIDDIIDDWKAEYGTRAYGKDGAFYRYIDYKIKKNLLLNLAQTLIDEGYTKDDLLDEKGEPEIKTRNKIVNACEAPDGASKRAKNKIKKSKDITAKEWKEVLKEFWRGKVSTFTPKDPQSLPPVETTFKAPQDHTALDLEPKDRIKLDTSDIKEMPLDLDFLKELGIDESFVTGKTK